MERPKHKLRVPRARKGGVQLLVGTRKGAFRLKSDSERKHWSLKDAWFVGHVVHHLVEDPRRKGVLLAAARTGHLGPTLFRSEDGGRTWSEARRPPRFTEAPEGLLQRTVNHTFWLTPGHADERDTWYAGTSPQGLFRSRDGGDTWKPVRGFNDHPDLDRWTGGEKDGTPDGPKLHSILVDPRDAAHLLVGMSSGGVFESLDAGRTWEPMNKGLVIDYVPGDPDFGHDPHCVVMSPTNPDRLWQQNHCGIFVMDREQGVWERVGESMPKDIGDIGFPIVTHPRDPDTAFVFPMDGTSVWARTSPGAAPAVFRTRDRGASWDRRDRGFPKEHAWWTVKRQCMAHDGHDPLGLYLGTTNGEVWGSVNEGKTWRTLVRHLPHVYSVEVAGVAP
ncbi:MAG: glycosyl hydrolase [Planctomycetota bacterium]|nr:glycosyl hydrolase [Planctomycetota bacterium]